MNTIITNIKKRGFVKTGVSLGINGLSLFDQAKLSWTGFDIDIAKCISVALLDDINAIEFIPLQSAQRFSALQSHEIDIGTFNATLNLNREVEYNLTFMEPLLFDGEALMVKKEELDKSKHIAYFNTRLISAIRGSTTGKNLEIYFANNKLNYDVIMSDTPDEALHNYENNNCNIYCLDRILLAGERMRLKQPAEHIILKDVISKEAMSPIISNQDPQWGMAVKWILKTLIEAEELGISKENLAEKKDSHCNYVRDFLNPNLAVCQKLGVIPNFTEKIIASVGNYADIYHRNLGDLSPLKLNRGENNLRSNGGLLFSPRFL